MTSLACALQSDLLPQISPAAAGMEAEILSALSAPSLTNVIMAGFILDNTLVSPLNRGRFYTYRNEQHELEELPSSDIQSCLKR